MGDVAISLNGVDYSVPLTTDPTQFAVYSLSGTPISVSAVTKAQLFGAAQAVMALNQNYSLGVDELTAPWYSALSAAINECSDLALEDYAKTASGIFVLTAAIGPEALSVLIPSAISSLAQEIAGLTVNSVDIIRLVWTLSNAANTLQVAHDYFIQNIVNSNGPIPYEDIRTAINNTQFGLGLGSLSAAMASQLPTLKNSDSNFITQFLSGFQDAISNMSTWMTNSLSSLSQFVTPLQRSVLGITGDLLDAINLAGTIQNQVDFTSAFTNALNSLAAQSEYSPLTPAGLLASTETFMNLGATSSSTQNTYAISVPGPISESAGTAIFTISRSDTSENQTLYFSTLPDLGTSNPNKDYYYLGIDGSSVTFLPGQKAATVPVTVNDLGITDGSEETFSVILQSNSNDSVGTYLTKSQFTIENNDNLLGSFYFSTNLGSISENAHAIWVTLTRTDATRAATVYVSTVQDQGVGNPDGNFYYKGIVNLPVTFAAGDLVSQPFELLINDLGLTSGSETFRLIAQQRPSDPASVSVASSLFTIVNNDGAGQGTGSPSAPHITTSTQALYLQQGTSATITSSLLDTTDSADAIPSDLTYRIVNPPSFGSIKVNGAATTTSFTQADLNAGLVTYAQNGAAASTDSFTFTVRDSAGNQSLIHSFPISITPAAVQTPPPPQTPVVTIALTDDTGVSALDNITSDPTVAGKADPGAKVVVSEAGNTVASVFADASGNWSTKLSSLADGVHTVEATETNSANLIGTAYLTFALDTTAPSAPSAPALAGGGTVSFVTTPTFRGTADSADNATVHLLEGGTVIGEGVAIDGSWSISTLPLGVGPQEITAIAIDQAGNISAPSAPSVVTVEPPPAGEVILNDAAMVASGAASIVGTYVDTYWKTGTITEYGPINSDGFTITNLNRSQFALLSWDAVWAADHWVGDLGEFYNGPNILTIPADGLLASPPPSGVPATPADTIDIRRSDGAAFSFSSAQLAPTGDYPTDAVFTGLTESGSTISEVVEFHPSSTSDGLQTCNLAGFGDVVDVKMTSNLTGSSIPTSIQFDNLVFGDAIPPITPPGTDAFVGPVDISSAAILTDGSMPLLKTDINSFNDGKYSYYGDINSQGFTIKGGTSSGGGVSEFLTENYQFASIGGYNYDGENSIIAANSHGAVFSVSRTDGASFNFDRASLDSLAPGSGTVVNFVGTKVDGTQVSVSVPLDSTQGYQTFTFGSQLTDLVQLQFSSTWSDFQFDDLGFSPSVACFATGSLIATKRGSVAVEALKIGDLVRTSRGDLRPVIWVGHRTIECSRHPRPWDVMPVRIQADAFGRGRPKHDLVLSPDHAVYLGGVLIPIRYLINGASVAQFSVSRITYWHVELPAHDLLVADGLPCESYLDTGNRSAFVNGGTVTKLHPDFAREAWRKNSCAPLVLDGSKLRRARQNLIDRLPNLGYSVTSDPDLVVLADGAPISPQAFGDWLCFALPDGTARLRLRSRQAAPADLDPASPDRRQLGVAVSRILLDGEELTLDDPRLLGGWNNPEQDWRWSEGDGQIDVTGIAVVELRVLSMPLRFAVHSDTQLWPEIHSQSLAAVGLGARQRA